MRKDFLGRGWGFPFRFESGRGSVNMSEYEANIRDCMTIILGTKPGERQMMPEFGCRAYELMFAPNTPSTAHLIARHIENALKVWEPRIEVSEVEAIPDSSGQIRVQIHYTIRSTQSAQELALLLTAGG